jgi:nitrate/nitrite-specific signal transduction histidine kinase
MKTLLLGLWGVLYCNAVFGVCFLDSIYIQEILVNGEPKTLSAQNTIEFPKGTVDLIINLDSFRLGDTLCYQLDGFDKYEIKSKFPQIRYTNIPGGAYTLAFYFIHSNKEKTKARKITLNKEKLWTEEWWSVLVLVFSFLILAIIIAFSWTFYYRWQQRKEQKLRDQISGDLHDEVGSSLSSIAFSIKSLERKVKIKAPETLPIIDDIYASSSTSIDNLRDAVWVINPKNDSIGELLDKMRSFAYLLLPAAEIELEFDNAFDRLGKDPNKLKINTKQRRNAYLMFKETLNNIVKHAQAKAVVIKIGREKNGVKIYIKDNGIGMDLEREYKGIGIKNFKKRAKESLIDLQLDSQLGMGTAITMFIPEM